MTRTGFTPVKISETGYWICDLNLPHAFDQSLATGLANFFGRDSVLDLGCGTGAYVRYFRDRGIKSKGYDGNPHTVALSEGAGEILDLTEPANLERHDWVLSLEVGEHIPAAFESIFVDNIHRHNRKGVVLSWAVEGQLGIGHVNMRNNRYIKDCFKRLGYSDDLESEESLRSKATLEWFHNTIMVFRKEARNEIKFP